MWHDLHCIAQEFTVWEKVGGSRQLGAPFVFSGCIHTHTQDVRFHSSRGTGAWPP